MQCKKCEARWTLEDGLGPGGSASPGQHFTASVTLILVGALLSWRWEWWAGLAPGLFGVLILMMAIGRSGYRERATAYQGSICPECGERNWIWPWSF